MNKSWLGIVLAFILGAGACDKPADEIPLSIVRAPRDSWITNYPTWLRDPNVRNDGYVAPELIVPVPVSRRPRAIALLSTAPILPADKYMIAELLVDGVPRADVLIRKAADRFRSESINREEQSKRDAFKANPAFKKWAEDARQSAEREEAKRGRVKPYLVRAVATNEPSGAFGGTVHGEDLLIDHRSMGASSGDVRVPVLIFLERMPQQIFVIASGAM